MRIGDELPKHLQKCGFQIECGVEQQKGSAKKHLDTREFKQQQELNRLKPETCVASGNMELTVKQTIMALAPTLERMKKRGFELAEIVTRRQTHPRRLPPSLTGLPNDRKMTGSRMFPEAVLL